MQSQVSHIDAKQSLIQWVIINEAKSCVTHWGKIKVRHWVRVKCHKLMQNQMPLRSIVQCQASTGVEPTLCWSRYRESSLTPGWDLPRIRCKASLAWKWKLGWQEPRPCCWTLMRSSRGRGWGSSRVPSSWRCRGREKYRQTRGSGGKMLLSNPEQLGVNAINRP